MTLFEMLRKSTDKFLRHNPFKTILYISVLDHYSFPKLRKLEN